MMKMFSAKRPAGLVLCGMLAATMLGGCLTAEQLEKRLTTFAEEQTLTATRKRADANMAKIAAAEQQIKAINDWKTMMAGITQTVEEMTAKLKALDGIPARVDGQDAKLTTLSNDAKAAKLARAELMTELAKKALKSRLDELFGKVDTAVATINNDIKLLKKKDEDLTTKTDNTKKVTDAAVLDLKSLKNAVATAQTAMENLTTKTNASMTAQDKKIAAMGEGMSGILTKEIDMLEKRITALKAALKGIEGNGPTNGGTTTP